MSVERAPEPGFCWTEIFPHRILTDNIPDLEELDLLEVDIHQQYELPSLNKLQEVWDNHEEGEVRAHHSDLAIAYSVFNPTAEGGVIMWYPSWRVSTQTPVGARSATIISALNPDYKVIVPEEAEGVNKTTKIDTRYGDFSDYADTYLLVAEKVGQPDVLAGSSRGGVIASYLATELEVKTLSIQETPMLPSKHSGLVFAGLLGVLDNLESGRQNANRDKYEEKVVSNIKVPPTYKNRSILDVPGLYFKQAWLVNGLARVSMVDILLDAIATNPALNIFMSHGQINIGIPVENTRQALKEIYTSEPGATSNIRYFESETGHYGTGHSARFGRLIRFAIDHSSH